MTRPKVVAITGASSGIGLATAQLFARNNWKVYNLSRRPAQQQGVTDIAVDVADEAAVQSAFAQIREETEHLDLLINNAGYGISGAVEFTQLEEAKRQFNVNFFGVVACIKAALPMLRKSQGRIICISSAAAVFAIPFQSFYSATKAALNTLVNALANELKPFAVSVCALQLGDVKTDFTDARAKSQVGDDIYAGAIARSVAVMEKDEQRGMKPETIAQVVYRIANKPRIKPLYTIGVKYKLFVLLHKLLPNRFVNWLVGKVYVE